MSSEASESSPCAMTPSRRPPSFLTLAPATSPSWPQMPAARAAAAAEPSSRRSSSASAAGGPRVIKLGPVHWGEHLDDDKGDFYSGPPA